MKLIFSAVSAAAVLAGASAWAQPGNFGNMAKFFGDNKAFTTKVEATMKSSSQPDPMKMEMTMSMLNGNTRMEMDMTTMMKGGAMAGRAAQMKQMGMDKLISIVRPDKKMTYNVYPNMNAYAETPMTDQQVADMTDTTSKIEKVNMGKETIDGHPCDKNQVTVTSDKGEKHVVMIWNATDNKDFPVKMEMAENGNTMTMKYTDVKLTKPDAKSFETPTGLTKYSSMQALVQGEMMKRAGAAGLGAPPPQK